MKNKDQLYVIKRTQDGYIFLAVEWSLTNPADELSVFRYWSKDEKYLYKDAPSHFLNSVEMTTQNKETLKRFGFK